MTRGQIAIIIDGENLITSTEFNGDMYPGENGHGDEVFAFLNGVEDAETYLDYVESFNDKYFRYEDEPLNYEKKNDELDFSKDYFDNWFSDYVYIKNLHKKPVSIIDEGGNKLVILPKQTKVFHFGQEVNLSKEAEAKRQVKSDLYVLNYEELDKHKTYNDILEICRKYDETYNDMNLVDFVHVQDIVDDEFVKFYIEDCKGDLNKIKMFLSDVYQDDYIYVMQNDGSIRNITPGDLRDLSQSIQEHIDDVLDAEMKRIQGIEMQCLEQEI